MATPQIAYDDLIADLVRYGGHSEQYWRDAYPYLSVDLFNAAMEAADECPLCLVRFISLTGRHALGCPAMDGTLADRIAGRELS